MVIPLSFVPLKYPHGFCKDTKFRIIHLFIVCFFISDTQVLLFISEKVSLLPCLISEKMYICCYIISEKVRHETKSIYRTP